MTESESDVVALPIQFHPEAELELNEAMAYYDQERDGLGLLFLSEIEHSLTRVSENPEIAPKELGVTRKLVIERFPFSIMYSVEETSILVRAIAHSSRRPYYWRGRSR